MTKPANHKTSVSTLAGASVVDVQGSHFGKVSDLAVAPAQDTVHVYSLLVRRRSEARGTRSSVPIAELQLTADGTIQLREGASLTPFEGDETSLLLERDLLDQQIIDINGHKVVRVNDVDLVWESAPDNPATLASASPRSRSASAEPSAASSRACHPPPSTASPHASARASSPGTTSTSSSAIPPAASSSRSSRTVSPACTPPTSPTSSKTSPPPSVRPSSSRLNEEVAAEALEEVNPKMQQTLIESLDSEQVAGIVEEMDPGAAADLLSELSDERSEAILEEMDPEERQEVEELLEFSGDSAAGRMTTEYLALLGRRNRSRRHHRAARLRGRPRHRQRSLSARRARATSSPSSRSCSSSWQMLRTHSPIFLTATS